MQPSEFWGTDTWSVMYAYDGYAISKGIKTIDKDPLTEGEIEELQQWMEEEDRKMEGRA